MRYHTRILAAAAAVVLLVGVSASVSAQSVGRPAAFAPNALAAMQASLRDISQKIRPSVVEINVTEVIKQEIPQFSSPFDWFFGPENGQGGQGAPQQRTFRQSALG
ncbi:MAG TPA: hypothetical protein VL359_11345, partial [bacterium]|nr:hypothetical protein [bacterium]